MKTIAIIDGVTTGAMFSADINSNFIELKSDITSGGTFVQVQTDWNAVAGLGVLLNKPSTFTPTAHIHSIANVTGLQTSLDGKSGTGHTHASLYAPLVHTHTQYSVTGHTHTSLYAPLVHIHTQYSATGHTHTIANITSLQSTLDGKSGTGHTHTGVYAIAAHTHAGVYEPVIPISGTTKYWRGDKTWQTLDKASVGLSNVLNVAPLNGDDIVTLLAPKTIRSTIVVLTQVGINTSWNAGLGSLYRLTLTGDTTLANPTNVVVGAIYQIEVNQNANGLHILSWGTNYKFPNGDQPIISLDPDSIDIITIYTKSATELLVTYVQNFI